MSKVRAESVGAEPSMLSPQQAILNGVGGNSPFLLVLDPLESDGSGLPFVLESSGYRLVSARSVADAIETVRSTRPALAVVSSTGRNRLAGSDRGLGELRLIARKLGIPLLFVVDAGIDLSQWIEDSSDSEDWVLVGSPPEEVRARVNRLILRGKRGKASDPGRGSPIDAQFSSLVVHDIRTPLNVIVLSLNMIEHSLPRHDPDVEESLLFIKENFRQIEQMVTQLGDYARLYESGPPLSASDFDPRRLVEALLEYRVSRPGLRMSPVRLDVQKTCPPEATLDQPRARMALDYALINANAAAQGDPIDLRLRGSAQRWIIELAIDRPPPSSVVSQELHPQVFERLCGSAAERRGMDLAIVARISEIFGGTARLEAVEGRGTTIILDWPLRIADGPLTT